MDKQEKIVCAAINDSDSAYNLEYITLYVHYPKGIKAYEKGSKKRILGFITNKNRFVDPVEAQQIAIACGQYRDPHVRIKSLEQSIEIGWDSVKYAKTSVIVTSTKKHIAEDQAKLAELKAGYLGNALRVEDLHYV